MAEDRQKRKWFLSLHRPIVTVDRQIVTFRIERFQAVDGFPFLILKNTYPKPPTERAQNAGDGGGNLTVAQNALAVWINCAHPQEHGTFKPATADSDRGGARSIQKRTGIDGAGKGRNRILRGVQTCCAFLPDISLRKSCKACTFRE